MVDPLHHKLLDLYALIILVVCKKILSCGGPLAFCYMLVEIGEEACARVMSLL